MTWLGLTGIATATLVALTAATSLYSHAASRKLANLATGAQAPALLISSTFHSRFKPVLHSFRYPVLYIAVELDTEGYVDALFNFGSRFWRVLSLRAEDYLGIKHAGTLKQKLWAHLHDHEVDTTNLARSLLITTPRLFGYAFNPVSFHYIYDTEDNLNVVVLEVNNTFGEKHVYVLNQEESTDKVRSGYHNAQTFSRRFHVSPFNDRSGAYQLQCRDPLEEGPLAVGMHLTLLAEDGSKKLTAQVNSIAAPVPTTQSSRVLWTLFRHGTAVFLTVPRILAEAYKLHYSKKLAVYLRPEPFEERSAIGRQAATPIDVSFKSRLIAFLEERLRNDPTLPTIVFDLLPASQDERIITLKGGEDTLTITVLSYGFFSSLFTSISPAAALLTDSLASSSPLFRVSDVERFLDLFPEGRPSRLQSSRAYFCAPDEVTIKALQKSKLDKRLKNVHLSTNPLDIDVLHSATPFQALRYKATILSTLLLNAFGNATFSKFATFAGEAGAPSDTWQRVRLYLVAA